MNPLENPAQDKLASDLSPRALLDDQSQPLAQQDALDPAGPEPTHAEKKGKIDMVEMAVSFLSPALLGKVMILYFGSNFSSKPGKGYGIGLSLAILFTLVMLGRFVWRYKDYSED
ncbi:MAG: hypothetical protein ACAI44_19165 [Candidatus Sericytochromatia bacterium]